MKDADAIRKVKDVFATVNDIIEKGAWAQALAAWAKHCRRAGRDHPGHHPGPAIAKFFFWRRGLVAESRIRLGFNFVLLYFLSAKYQDSTPIPPPCIVNTATF
jgi:hypothetical protein